MTVPPRSRDSVPYDAAQYCVSCAANRPAKAPRPSAIASANAPRELPTAKELLGHHPTDWHRHRVRPALKQIDQAALRDIGELGCAETPGRWRQAGSFARASKRDFRSPEEPLWWAQQARRAPRHPLRRFAHQYDGPSHSSQPGRRRRGPEAMWTCATVEEAGCGVATD